MNPIISRCMGIHQYNDVGNIKWGDVHIFHNNLNSHDEYKDPFPNNQDLKIPCLTCQNRFLVSWVHA